MNYTLLLVDDEPHVLDALRRVFSQQSYRILCAQSGPQALEIMERESVQLIICDYRMPEVTGAELLTSVRARWPDTIRIMLTGYADIQSIMAAVKENSVFKFMTKPWQDDDLRITVARALEQYQLQQDVKHLVLKNQKNEERFASIGNQFSQDRGMLLEILRRHKRITTKQYKELASHKSRSPEPAYRLVLAQTELSEERIASTLTKALSVEPVDLKECRVSAEAAAVLPPDVCCQNLLLPIKLLGDELTLAMADPSDIFKRDGIETLTGCRVNVLLAKGTEIAHKIQEVYGAVTHADDSDRFDPMDEIDIVIEPKDEIDVEEVLQSSVISPVVRIVNCLLAEALSRGASDVHIEPRVKHTAVRFRIDGLLQERVRLPPSVHSGVVSRIKILAKMDIAQRRRPQDGRITVRSGERMVDLRASSVPVLYGEKVVLRILDQGAVVKRMEELGIESDTLERFRIIARQPQGMFIATGPTGSGKTTLLYSILREHLRSEKSYTTIEDPVEYCIEEASQVYVRDKTGLTFPVALRAMLRQDPDVLLVGEMRDRETCEIGFQAAMTGHLVLSTLHTISAVASITRLVDLGVKRYLIASSLNCVVAQRLLRKTCRKCRVPSEPDPAVLDLLGLKADDVTGLQSGSGCDGCNGAGFSGRIGVFEVFEITDPIRELILTGAEQAELRATAREGGMISLFEDAISKVRHGATTLEEVLRVLGPRLLAKPCSHCGEELEPEFRACPSCGRATRRRCCRCNNRIESGWRFCVNCGQPCPTEAVEIQPNRT